MRPLLDKLISPYQSAFIPDRSTYDNILFTHEIMHKFNKCSGKTSWVAMILDMKKAYDQLEWDFVQKCFQELGFHPQWIKWITEYISPISYSLLVNDELNGLFQPSRGIRQGDPLSPYIFILCMEVFSHISKEANIAGSGIGIKLCFNSLKILCLLFADDYLLFCKTNQQTISTTKAILDRFCDLSGQLVNFHKSVLTFSRNTSNLLKQLVMATLAISHSSSLGTYRGCPVFYGKPSKNTFQELINKAATKLSRWKANSLSKAGRTVLIQLHLESLPAHTMQCFQLPSATSTSVDQIHRNFFWKKSNTEQGIPLVAWDKVCQPKTKGGLGLHKTEAVNTAFQCKLACKILNNNTGLWAQSVKAKYLCKCGFLQYQSKPADSPVWKNLLKCRNLLKQGIRWKSGRGNNISFWFDNWVDNHNLVELLGIPLDAIPEPNVVASDFINNDRSWNAIKLQQCVQDHNFLLKLKGSIYQLRKLMIHFVGV